MTRLRGFVSIAGLISPSFSEVQVTDIITPGSEDEVEHSHMNKENEERQAVSHLGINIRIRNQTPWWIERQTPL